MKVLWYVNIVLPEIAQRLNFKVSNAGGWLVRQSELLSKNDDVELMILNATRLVKDIKTEKVDGIEYILSPENNYINDFLQILTEKKPDIVHVFGTEYEYNTEIIRLCNQLNIKFVVSIQGIMSESANNYMHGLPEKFNKISIPIKIMKKIYYADSIKLSQKDFYNKGVDEIKALKMTKNIIGRTKWDKDYILNVNPNANYYHVNENLRKEFYCNTKWEHEKCEKYSIFLSQWFYPIKGFHQLLKIMPRLIKKYPNIKIYVGGQMPYTLKNKFLDIFVNYFFEYQSYIQKEIKNNKLEKYIKFTGSLNAQQMKEMFLKSNLFLSPSTIENSPNSVGEAMILGVPIVASNVGGVSSIIEDEKEGLLYDFFDLEEMFNDITRIFDDENFASNLGENAKYHALITHDGNRNTFDLLSVYKNSV